MDSIFQEETFIIKFVDTQCTLPVTIIEGFKMINVFRELEPGSTSVSIDMVVPQKDVDDLVRFVTVFHLFHICSFMKSLISTFNDVKTIFKIVDFLHHSDLIDILLNPKNIVPELYEISHVCDIMERKFRVQLDLIERVNYEQIMSCSHFIIHHPNYTQLMIEYLKKAIIIQMKNFTYSDELPFYLSEEILKDKKFNLFLDKINIIRSTITITNINGCIDIGYGYGADGYGLMVFEEDVYDPYNCSKYFLDVISIDDIKTIEIDGYIHRF